MDNKTNKIKELRLSKKISRQELAEGIGISVSSIESYELGRRVPSLETWFKLADYFGVSVSELMGIDTVNKVIADMKKAGNIIDAQGDSYLSNQLKRIEKDELSAHDKLVLSQAMALTMNIQKDYSDSNKQLVADFNSVIDFMFMLSSTKDATDDDNRLEENDWFEELKQENIKKFDKLITTLYNNQIKAKNKKASDDKPETEG
ncbi:helix-turn-helix transcriptional regulator [Leuconostoc lactis]|uniref:helix-turn-helix transcriptional regulator n=1 Tax=Leuconostoc lactis TaxID=1246 RepID=UPI0011BBC43B|nr:helix-turn-helix transcriptional regulator [Leuconostoc lactis]QEA50859.1 helix-turn-helix transcriptional regulator [Leuconostoc lactis]